MLPQSFMDYSPELSEWFPDFKKKANVISKKFQDNIATSIDRNHKIQETFGFEWGLLKKNKNTKIWNLNVSEYKTQLLTELKLPTHFKCKYALDAGCGHGRSAGNMTVFSENVFGVEVSRAVEFAYGENNKKNCHFLQADIHFLPFPPETFDLVYCSGVLHHNPSTLMSFKKISLLVSEGGRLSVWLYHPFKSIVHSVMCKYRKVTTRLPVALVFYINAITITPFQWVVSQVKGKKKKFIEIAIEQLDMLTPSYRHEHTHDEVKQWMEEDGFKEVALTDQDRYGFSICGVKYF